MFFLCSVILRINTLNVFPSKGPLQNTCGHFWEMVWEQRTRGVVMLNRIIEKGSVSISFLPVIVNLCVGLCHRAQGSHGLSFFFFCAVQHALSFGFRSNVPNTGLKERRRMLSLKMPTSSSPLSQRTSNLTTQSVSWSWKICL